VREAYVVTSYTKTAQASEPAFVLRDDILWHRPSNRGLHLSLQYRKLISRLAMCYPHCGSRELLIRSLDPTQKWVSDKMLSVLVYRFRRRCADAFGLKSPGLICSRFGIGYYLTEKVELTDAPPVIIAPNLVSRLKKLLESHPSRQEADDVMYQLFE
jgi:hypothetical protein